MTRTVGLGELGAGGQRPAGGRALAATGAYYDFMIGQNDFNAFGFMDCLVKMILMLLDSWIG